MSIALPIPAPQHNHLLAHLPPCFSSVGTLPRSPLRRGGPSPGSDPSPISSLSQGLPGDGSLPAGMPEAGAAPFRFHNSSCPARGGWETPGAVTGRQRASRGRPPRLREAALSRPPPPGSRSLRSRSRCPDAGWHRAGLSSVPVPAAAPRRSAPRVEPHSDRPPSPVPAPCPLARAPVAAVMRFATGCHYGKAGSGPVV